MGFVFHYHTNGINISLSHKWDLYFIITQMGFMFHYHTNGIYIASHSRSIALAQCIICSLHVEVVSVTSLYHNCNLLY